MTDWQISEPIDNTYAITLIVHNIRKRNVMEISEHLVDIVRDHFGFDPTIYVGHVKGVYGE